MARACERLGWPLAHVFVRDRFTGLLVCSGIWHDEHPQAHAALRAATARLALGPGEGIPGRVLALGGPIWIEELALERTIPRRGELRACGLRCAFAFPILGEHGIEGVVELLGPAPPRNRAGCDERSLWALAAELGTAAGRVLDHERIQRALRELERVGEVGSWSWDVCRDRFEFSPELARMHGVDGVKEGSLEPRHATRAQWLESVHRDDREAVEVFCERLVRERRAASMEFRVGAGARTRWLRTRAEIVREGGGRALLISGYTQDITARRTVEQRRGLSDRDLAHQCRILERIASGQPLGETLDELCRHVERGFADVRCSVLVVDRERWSLRCAAAPSLPGGLRAAIDGMAVGEGVGASGTAAARGETVTVSDIEADPLTADFVALAARFGLRSVWSVPITGRGRTLLGTLAVYHARRRRPGAAEQRAVAAAVHLAALAIDRARIDRRLLAAAQRDQGSGLCSRAHFLELVNAALAEPGPPANGRLRVGVLFVALEPLGPGGRELGHQLGDRIAAEIAARLAQVLGREVPAARFGELGFAAMALCPDARALERLAERLSATVALPIAFDGGEFAVSANVGAALALTPIDAYGLVCDAEAAMHAARARGPGSHQLYDRRLHREVIGRLGAEGELRLAIARGELELHYQPVMDLRSGRFSGVEALVRWRNPRRGLLFPEHFIALAEETGVIAALGERVLTMAIGQAAQWHRRMVPLQVGVNVSVHQLSAPGFAAGVLARLEQAGLAADTLVLEVTESAVMPQLDVCFGALRTLADHGVRIYVDDFGTGYSSIARLGELPICGLKIDRRFIAALSGDPVADSVLAAIVALARAHGLMIVAEGVEHEHELATVRKLGCEHAQGFHIGRPAAPEAIEPLLRGRLD